jgi:hypothetical protein
MNFNYTDISIVVDRSGSMESIMGDMEGAIKHFLDEQKKVDGKCTVSLYEFDYAYNPVYENVPVKETKDYVLNPRGATALNDAIGRTINSLGAKYSNMPEDERPGKIFFIVVTDGHENASKEFTAAKIKEMVKHQSDVYNWSFVYLGANQDAVLNGSQLGFNVDNSMTYAASQSGVACMADVLSRKVNTVRGMMTPGEYVMSKNALFTAEDKALQNAANKV